MSKGYIYLRQHENYDHYNIYKLGKTINFIGRDATYSTGEFIRGKFIFGLEILKQNPENINDTFVEKLLQRYFKNYHRIYDGGTEFYDKKIIDEIEPFLNKTTIKFKILTNQEILNINKKIQRQVLLDKLNANIKFMEDLRKIKNKNLTKEIILRNEIQLEYLKDILEELNKNSRVFIKAPTGFGKTHIFYKTISSVKPNKILVLTPRLLLNQQITEVKYTKYIKDDNYKIYHFSDEETSKKEKLLININNSKTKFILTSCYQSKNKLLELIEELKITFDLIIFDEAHFIDNWDNSEFVLNETISKNRIFASATPTDEIEIKPNIFGKIIEKVKVYELINKEILCNIVTLVKQINNNKNEYHDLKNLIVEAMTKYNKKKGIIYVNNTKNAENLYNLMKMQNKINSYIYVSKEIDTANENDIDIKKFEDEPNPCIIIVVGKLGYGYDNDFIDFICLGDPRQSDIDIRQILGRGLRWNKGTYPNKLLHLLVPLYKDDFGKYSDYDHLKKYLDYIIGECGQDIIIKGDGTGFINGNKNNFDGKNYDGETIPIEILQEYCTTGYNKFTDFMKFLKANKVFDEIEYNEFRETQQWMPEIGLIHKRYPKFCFRDIHPENLKYYWTKEDAKLGKEIANKKLIEIITFDKYKKLNEYNKMEKIKELNIDDKIPFVNLNYYYPNENILDKS